MKFFSLLLSITMLIQGVSFIPPCQHSAAQNEEDKVPACCLKSKKNKGQVCSIEVGLEENKNPEKDSCCGDFCKCTGKTAKTTITFRYFEANYKSLFNHKTGFRYHDWYEFDYLSRLLEPPQLA
jgi:hypothetical protein